MSGECVALKNSPLLRRGALDSDSGSNSETEASNLCLPLADPTFDLDSKALALVQEPVLFENHPSPDILLLKSKIAATVSEESEPYTPGSQASSHISAQLRSSPRHGTFLRSPLSDKREQSIFCTPAFDINSMNMSTPTTDYKVRRIGQMLIG